MHFPWGGGGEGGLGLGGQDGASIRPNGLIRKKSMRVN